VRQIHHTPVRLPGIPTDVARFNHETPIFHRVRTPSHEAAWLPAHLAVEIIAVLASRHQFEFSPFSPDPTTHKAGVDTKQLLGHLQYRHTTVQSAIDIRVCMHVMSGHEICRCWKNTTTLRVYTHILLIGLCLSIPFAHFQPSFTCPPIFF
jgi:hypothetical protein